MVFRESAGVLDIAISKNNNEGEISYLRTWENRNSSGKKRVKRYQHKCLHKILPGMSTHKTLGTNSEQRNQHGKRNRSVPGTA